MGVFERNILKETSSQKSIASLIILCSKFTITQDPRLLTISTQVLGIPQRQKRHFPGLNELRDEKYQQNININKTVGEEKECTPGAN